MVSCASSASLHCSHQRPETISFDSPSQPAVQVIRKSHVAKFLVEAILAAYRAAPDANASDIHANAHEVRAVAHSWAYFAHATLGEVLEGAWWKSTTTFAGHYLRDMALQVNAQFHLGPVVTAQRIHAHAGVKIV